MKLSHTVGRGLEYSSLFLAILSALGMTSIVGIIFVSVVLRKIFGTPLFFTEEVVGMLMSISLFLALPMVTLRNKHIQVTVVATFFEQRSQAVVRVLSVLSSLVCIAFCSWLIVEAVPWLEFAIKHNLKYETSRVLLAPGMAVLPISVSLMGLIFVARLFGWIEQKQQEETAIAVVEIQPFKTKER